MHSVGDPALWVGFLIGVLLLLAIDLGLFHRRPHAVGFREAGIWTVVWIALAVAFGAGVWIGFGPKAGMQYFAGYLIEKGLSVDNLFVFVVVFRSFAVPKELQHRVLFWGILGAILMRGIFIWIGAALVQQFEWVLYGFGLLLVVTGIRLVREQDEELDPFEKGMVRWLQKRLPLTSGYRGAHFFVREGGRFLATPLLLVLAVVETSDVIFATDSIPAIFGVTRDPFIVFSSNIFAILGLRALFFLLAGVLDRFRTIKYGLALVLVFIGAKLLLKDVFEIPVGISLGIVVGLLLGSFLLSFLITKKDDRSEAEPEQPPRPADYTETP